MTQFQILASVIGIFFVLMMGIIGWQTVIRLAGIEEYLEKVSILLAVMASKQGATQDDILAATQVDAPSNGKAGSGKSKK